MSELNYFTVKKEDKSIDIAVQNMIDGKLVVIGNMKEEKINDSTKIAYTHLNDYVNALYQPEFAQDVLAQVKEKQVVYLSLGDSIVFRKEGETEVSRMTRHK
ncbi:MAG: hypothetical protein AABX39_01030 [Nanoarchaeota archaeon]